MTIGAEIEHRVHTQWQWPKEVISRDFTLFEAKDEAAWAIFLCTFLGLLLFDNLIIFGKPKRLGFFTALCYTFFWGATAFAFCFWLGRYQGAHSAYMWFSGYTLQWMMSFDNLFVFHLIFKVYATPDELKHKPLFLGLLGQAVFTFSLLTFGEYIFHKLMFLHIVFGLFFIYIGVASALGDDEDDDPTENPMIQWLQAKLPFVSAYDVSGHFFVRLPIDENGKVFIPAEAIVSKNTPLECPDNEKETPPPATKRAEDDTDTESTKSTENSYSPSLIDVSKVDLAGQKTELRATMLFLLVCTMEISDVIFSVDTIVAVSVQVGDLYLAFTCVAFALLTLRATFFIVEVLVQMFSLMKYGIGAILVYIGCKLIIDRWFLVPHIVDLCVLIGTFGGSILASAIWDKYKGEDEEEEGNAASLLSSPQ